MTYPSLWKISSKSHEDLWHPIDAPAQPNSFIFSTSLSDPNPYVIFELPENLNRSPQWALITNRCGAGPEVSNRALGIYFEASQDGREWTPLQPEITMDFVEKGATLEIELPSDARFLKIGRNGGSSHFHLNSIEIVDKVDRERYVAREFIKFCRLFCHASHSQRLQDLFALYVNGFAPNYFVEFGIADGVSLSNSLLLEAIGWTGVCGEALDHFYRKACSTRRAKIVHCALSSRSGDKLEFHVAGLISSFASIASRDLHAAKRAESSIVTVTTSRLDQILDQANAPGRIGFLSLDIEGAEFDVLSNFPFDRYRFNCAAIEHNHTEDEKKIDEIFYRNGYSRVLRSLSGHDAFYVDNQHRPFNWTNSNLGLVNPNPKAPEIIKKASQFLDFGQVSN